MRQICKIGPFVIRTGAGCVLIGLTTFLCYSLQLNFSVTGFIYLIVIVLQSLAGSFASSAVVSVVAVFCLDFFFTAPLFSFEVTNPLDILALISFLTTGVVITRLTTRVRQEAAISDGQRHQVDRLYQLAQKLLALNPETTTYSTSTKLFQDVFGLQAVCLFDAATGEVHCTSNQPSGLADRTRTAYSSGEDSEDGGSGILIRCLHASGNTIGAISFEGLRDPELTAGPLSALAAAMLDNACKYAPPGSAVKVSLELQNEKAAVRVLNRGTAIRAHERTRIFVRFYRGVEAQRLAPGSGLGLYFAHRSFRPTGEAWNSRTKTSQPEKVPLSV